jgi:transposase
MFDLRHEDHPAHATTTVLAETSRDVPELAPGYVVRTGCSWRQLPSDFPPWQTVYWYFVRWEDA